MPRATVFVRRATTPRTDASLLFRKKTLPSSPGSHGIWRTRLTCGSILNGPFGWSGPQALGWMCEAGLSHFLAGKNSDVEPTALLCSDSDSYTDQVTESEQVLGRSIDEPVVAEAFESLPLGEIVPHLMSTAPQASFLRELESFCWRFGKTPPSWLGRPLLWSAGANDAQIISAIKSARLGKSKDVRVLQAESMRKCRECGSGLRATLATAGQGIVERFDRLLEWARYWGQALNDRHGLLAGLLWERELVWHVGTRLQQEGMIGAPINVLTFERDDLEKVRPQRQRGKPHEGLQAAAPHVSAKPPLGPAGHSRCAAARRR